jgi:hypothetical protein
MMIVALLSRANDKAGLREDSYHETPINGGRDRHPKPGLLLVVTLHLHHSLPTIGYGLGSFDDPRAIRSCGRIANRAKKAPLPTTRRIGWMIK